MKKIKAVEGKERVVRAWVYLGFANRNGIEVRLGNLVFEQGEMRREFHINMASDELFWGYRTRRTVGLPSRLRQSQRIDVFFAGDREQRAILGWTHEDREVLHQ